MKRITTFAALLLLAVPLAAQQPRPMPRDTMRGGMPEHEMMSHMSEMRELMGPMMRGMAFAPAQLLERKDVLQLTDQQATRLTTLRDEAKRTHEAAAAEAKRHMDALDQTMQKNPVDTAALRTHFQAAHTAMGNAQWSALRASAQARAALTDVQRARVEGWMDAMRMHRQRRDQDGPPQGRP